MNINELEELLKPAKQEEMPQTLTPLLRSPASINIWATSYTTMPYPEYPTSHTFRTPGQYVEEVALPLAQAIATRRSGRTTRIILKALVEASEGRDIYFIAPTLARAQNMYSRAISIAERCGLGNERFHYASEQRDIENTMRGNSNSNIRFYHDHGD